MVESLRRDLSCESLLDCVHGLKALDRDCFQVLVEADAPRTVDDIAAEVDRERSTTYRAVQRLLEADLVEQEQRSREGGSYYHVYAPADPDAIVDDMQRTLNDWYAQMGQLIQEFEDKYADAGDRVAVER